MTDPQAGAARFDWDSVGNLLAVERWQMSEVELIQLTPASGAPGAVVEIEGTGFDTTAQDNEVEFNGVAATVTDATEIQLTVVVPTQATSGPVTVDAPGGSATSARPFQVLSSAAPTISGISPTVVAAGDVTTVTGTNFDPSKPANSAVVNRTRAAVRSATTTTLGVETPVAAGSGRVSVTTVDGTATSPYLFVAQPPYTPADVAETGVIPFGQNVTKAVPAPGKIVLLVFEGEAGDRVALKATGSGMAGSAGIYQPNGSHLKGAGFSSGSQAFLDTVTLPVDGTYTLRVNGTGAQTGSVTLNLVDVPQDVIETFQPSPTGDSKTLTPTVPGQNLRATFQGTAGQRIFVKVANGDADRSELIDPDGTVLDGSPEWVYNTQTYYIDTITLGSSGLHTVLVDPRGVTLPGSTITIYSVPEPIVRDIDPVSTGDSESLSLAVGQMAKLRFDGTEGQRISVKSASPMSGSLILTGPDGEEVAASNISSSSVMEPVTLPEDGTYTLTADPHGIESGTATITTYDFSGDVVEEFEPSAGGDTRTLTPVAAGQNLRATFDGDAGDRILVTASGGAAHRAELVRSDGSVVVDFFPQLPNSTTRYMDTLVLPDDDTYTVFIDQVGADIEASTVTIYAVPEDDVRDVAPPVGGDPETFDLTVGQVAKIRFQGAQGQRVSLKNSNTSFSGPVTLRRPNGVQLASGTLGSTTSLALEPVELPEAGTYTITADLSYLQSGSLTLTTYDVPPDVTEEFDPTASGDTKTLTPQSAGQNLRATFEATAGQRVFIKASNGSAHRAQILRPNGTVLASNPTAVPGQPTNYFSTRTLTEAGTYTVFIDPRAAEMDSSTITIYDVPPDDTRAITPVVGGHDETFDPSVGQAAKLTFSGTQGQRISIEPTDYSFSGQMRLDKPDGSTLASASIGDSTDFIEPVALPVSGTYTVVMTRSDIQEGPVTITTYDVPDDVTESFTPTAGGDTSTLTPLSAGQNLRATFQANAGARVFVKVSDGWASKTKLLRPDGSTLVGSPTSIPNTQTYYIDTTVLPTTGTYTVFVDPQKADMDASTVTVYAVPNEATGTLAASVPGDSLPLSLSVGQGAALSFNGTPGQKIQVQTSNSAIGEGTLTVKRPNGATLTSLSLSTSVRTTSVQTLADNGTYSITVNPSRLENGNITVTLFDKTGLVSGPSGFTTTFAAATVQPTVRPALKRPIEAKVAPAADRSPPDGTRPPRRASGRGSRSASRPPDAGKPAAPGDAVRRHLRIDPATRDFQPTEGASWRPAGVNQPGGWMSGSPDTPWSEIASRQAPPGVTALAGQVLKVNGVPLAGATVQLDGDRRTAVTDSSGRFLLTDATPGEGVLVVEANGIPGTDARFGIHSFQVDLERGTTTALEQPVWLTALDPAGDFAVPERTRKPVVLTNPRIPGFRVEIPAGSEIRDRDGKPVRNLNLTAVPLDRTPFPLPHFDVPAYFTIQPGGAYLSKGARVIYPNYMQASPKQRVQFWNYDAEDRGWHVYGYGRVSDDAKRMEPDPGVRIWELTGAMVGTGTGPPPDAPTPTGGVSAADPVDLGTGLFVETNTDLHVPDIIPAVVQRTYRPGDSNYYSFGRATTSFYDTRIWSPLDGADNPWLIRPDGSNVPFERANPAAPDADALYEPIGASGELAGMILARNDDFGFDLRFRDGMTYVFGNYSPLTAIRDAAGNQLTITRDGGDARGLIEQITTPNGRWIRFDYNAQNRIVRAIDNAGREVSYAYNAEARLSEITDVNGGVSSRAYDAAGQMTALTDARGLTYVENTYDANGRVVEQELADGGVYEFDYDLWPNGRVQRAHVTNPRGTVRTVTFGESQYAVSDVVAVGEAIEQATTIERDGDQQIVGLTDELGRETEIDYDADGNVVEVTESAGTADARTTTATYGPLSRLTSITDPLMHTTTLEHDFRGRLTSLVDATNREYTLSYAGSDTRPSILTDPADASYELDYAGGDLIAVRDPLGRETRFYTDAAGRRTRAIGPSGGTRSFRYDDGGLLRKTVAPTGATTEFDYDANGNLTEVVDARSNAITATYDVMDRVASFTDALNGSATFEHDENGNLTKVIDRAGKVTTLRYDPLDRLEFGGYDTTGTPGNEQYESTVEYSYDDGDRLVEADDSSAGVFTHAFDDFDQVISETGPNGSVGYGFDDAGRMTSVDVPTQPSIAYAYDDAGRLTAVTRGSDSVGIGYDAAGRRAGVTLPNGVVQQHTYDARSQITGIDYLQSGVPIGDLHYQYGPGGQRTAMWGSLANPTLPASLAATYDAANRRIAQDAATLTYDAAGNLTGDDEASYVWNARHELESVTRGQSLTTFEYDPFGRRTARTVDNTKTDYLHARRNVVQEQQNGSPTANLISGPGVDDLFARVTPGGTDSRLTDALGSTIALTDPLGWPADTTYQYGPFGETTQAGAPNDNPYQFTGRENDGNGLYHYRARYYRPDQQRFLSEDPLGLAGGDTNFYTYAANDPANRTDPLGLLPSFADFATSTTGTFDTLTFGTTIRIRKAMGIGFGGVDPCSDVYRRAGGLMRQTIAIEVGFLSGKGASTLFQGWGVGPVGAALGGGAYGGATESFINGDSLVGGAAAGAVGGGFGGFVTGKGTSSMAGDATDMAVGGAVSLAAGGGFGDGDPIGLGRGKCDP